ncbi:Friend leukemia integration 1 transcription factor [Octopus sinensis]|uniref:Friend leukemia integration 1 transcription factor n=1 Tax=Octopus sinensis TaxID=2607531 RepID=A0A6P7SDP1_9MOLL|nr:Friend leukemia integration 1 transcription factor [Octopus sinensis]
MTLDYHISDFRTDVDKSIYDQTREEKKFFDKVLGLRSSVSDEAGIESMDLHHFEDDQTVPSKLTELPYSLMASPGSAFHIETADHCLELPRAPPPSYEEHKIISKFHHQELSHEDQAARWEDIQDIIRRESSVFTNLTSVSSFSSSVKSENRPGLDCQIQSWTSGQLVPEVPSNSGSNCSIGQTPDWYSNSVPEPVCYMSLESIMPSARSTNSSPASTTGSFAPTYNSYPPSMASNPSFFDPTSTSRCTPSPSYENNNGSNVNNNHNSNITNNILSGSNNCSPSNNTLINKKQRSCKKISEESPDKICGMTFQQLMSHIPESGHIQLWQFLIKLLCDKTNNNCIRWEGDEGHFTILNQEELAKRWGERKRRKQMTYEKLSRAIRYYYDKNYVHKIHGKKATYKFNFDELLKSSSRPSHQSKNKETDESTTMVQSYDISSFPATMPVTPASSSSPSSSMQSTSSGIVFNSKRPLNTSSPYGSELPEYSPPLTSKKQKLPYIPNMSQPCYSLEQHFNQNSPYLDASSLFNEENTQTYY